MNKLVVTVNIGNYLPDITRLTYPFMQAWAKKIGAEWIEITEREFDDAPGFERAPLNIEKFQLQRISAKFDWTYFLDCDALISPDTPDWAEMVNDKSVVLFNGVDNRLDRFRSSSYSRRSGSRAGACTWNVICSDWTGPDLWQPPTDYPEAVKNISALWCEAKTGNCHPNHLIDDYQLSENIARYGLKVKTIASICDEMRRPNVYYTHLYNCTPAAKLKAIREKLDEMGIAYP